MEMTADQMTRSGQVTKAAVETIPGQMKTVVRTTAAVWTMAAASRDPFAEALFLL
jgi:hypothetical protein